MASLNSNTTAASSSRQFPAGLRVLVVDEDIGSLLHTQLVLEKCNYNVTSCNGAEAALSLLLEEKSGFDTVLYEINMSKKNGLEFLEVVNSEKLSVPVVLLSEDRDFNRNFNRNVAMNGVKLGACDILIKPLSSEKVQFLWQHSLRRKDDSKPSKNIISDTRIEGEKMQEKIPLKWVPALEDRFLNAVHQLGGFKNAKPKAILNLMGVVGLNTRQISSRLQKYRRYLKTDQLNTSGARARALQASHDFPMAPSAHVNNISSPASLHAPIAYADGLLHPPIASISSSVSLHAPIAYADGLLHPPIASISSSVSLHAPIAYTDGQLHPPPIASISSPVSLHAPIAYTDGQLHPPPFASISSPVSLHAPIAYADGQLHPPIDSISSPVSMHAPIAYTDGQLPPPIASISSPVSLHAPIAYTDGQLHPPIDSISSPVSMHAPIAYTDGQLPPPIDSISSPVSMHAPIAYTDGQLHPPIDSISSPVSLHAPIAYADGQLHPPIACFDGFQYNSTWQEVHPPIACSDGFQYGSTWEEVQNIDSGNYYLTYDANESVVGPGSSSLGGSDDFIPDLPHISSDLDYSFCEV